MTYLSHNNNITSYFNNWPAKQRLDTIINHEDPQKLMAKLPVLDIIFMIRDVGLESSLELVELLSPKQIQYIIDLEAWPNDIIHHQKLADYFALFFASCRDKAIDKISVLDIELIGLLFKKLSLIYDTTLEEEPDSYGDLYSISPGGQFIVCFIENHLSQYLHMYLEDLYNRDLSLALRFLRELRFELVTNLEEECQKARQHRLQDLGLMPREERLEFFSSLSIHEVRKIINHNANQEHNNNIYLSPSPYAKDNKYPLLKSLFLLLSDQEKQAFDIRIRHITLNMHASLNGDFGEQKSIKLTGEYVKFLCELALMQLNNHDLNENIKHVDPKYLVRLGRTSLLAMRKRLYQASFDHNIVLGKNFALVDTPLRELAKAISLPEPRFYDGLIDPNKYDVRYFASIHDIKASMDAINEIIFRGQFIGIKGLGFSVDNLSELNLSHASIIARTLINKYLENKNLLTKITTDSLIKNNDRLHDKFIQSSRQYVDDISTLLTKDSNNDFLDINNKAHRLLNAIFAQLEQNSSLLLN